MRSLTDGATDTLDTQMRSNDRLKQRHSIVRRVTLAPVLLFRFLSVTSFSGRGAAAAAVGGSSALSALLLIGWLAFAAYLLLQERGRRAH